MYITADDFGLSEAVNRAIIDLAKSGRISFISLLVNMPSTQSAIDLYHKYRPCPIGLHFNLIEGKPISDPRKIPTLVDRQGNFFPWPVFWLRLLAKKISVVDVRRELYQQINFMEQKKLTVSHINSHQHIHLLPLIKTEIMSLSQKKHIAYIRQFSSVIRRLRKYPLKLAFFYTALKITQTFYQSTTLRNKITFEEIIVHPGTNYD